MATHYFKLPGKVDLVECATGTVITHSKDDKGFITPLSFSHRNIVKIILRSPRVQKTFDLFEIADLRTKLMGDRLSPVELTETEWFTLAEECKNPTPPNTPGADSWLSMDMRESPDVVRFLRSIADAPTTKPEVFDKKAVENGSAMAITGGVGGHAGKTPI